jgi:putative ABC transport system permease protein
MSGSRKVAWRLGRRSLLADRTRVVGAIAGIAFSAFLMAVEIGLLHGFTLAASRVVDALDAHVWITARGVPSIDFASPIARGTSKEIAMAAPGISSCGHAAITWAPFVRADGSRTMVLMVSVEEGFLGRVPSPRRAGIAAGGSQEGIVVDRTDVSALGGVAIGTEVEIAGRRARIVEIADGFSSFMGTPLVFADYSDGREYLGLAPGQASAITCKLRSGHDVSEAVRWLQQRMPELDVWSAAELSDRSRRYWLVQTGAGGALSVAALLGFAIGLAIVSQTIFGLTVDAIEEFATIKAIGGAPAFVTQVVLAQALMCGAAGCAVGLLLAAPAMLAIREVVTWATQAWWVHPLVAILVLVMCWGAATLAARPALKVDPARVFRA